MTGVVQERSGVPVRPGAMVVSGGDGVRPGLVARVRRELAAGTYETYCREAKLDTAVERMLPELLPGG